MINIIIVEDDKRILQFCSDVLCEIGDDINVIHATNAEKALEALERTVVDGAFIDIGLPGMNGFSLVKQIRSMDNYHMLPIIFESGEDNDCSETYKRYNNIDYITKPYTRDQFFKMSIKLINEIYAQKRVFDKNDKRTYVFDFDKEKVAVRISDILYATIENRNVKLVTRSNYYYQAHISLDNLILDIGSEMIVRCHKSYAVNVENVVCIKPNQYSSNKAWNIFFRDAENETCQLSLNYKKKFNELFLSGTTGKGV